MRRVCRSTSRWRRVGTDERLWWRDGIGAAGLSPAIHPLVDFAHRAASLDESPQEETYDTSQHMFELQGIESLPE